MLASSDDPRHCFWCGYGPCAPSPYRGEREGPGRGGERLPRNLGAIQAEGKHPDLALDNVVRLDRLRKPAANARRAA